MIVFVHSSISQLKHQLYRRVLTTMFSDTVLSSRSMEVVLKTSIPFCTLAWLPTTTRYGLFHYVSHCGVLCMQYGINIDCCIPPHICNTKFLWFLKNDWFGRLFFCDFRTVDCASVVHAIRTGPSHAGRQGRPGPPHFFGQFFFFDFIEKTENNYWYASCVYVLHS